jgi:hypothetical protein
MRRVVRIRALPWFYYFLVSDPDEQTAATDSRINRSAAAVATQPSSPTRRLPFDQARA